MKPAGIKVFPTMVTMWDQDSQIVRMCISGSLGTHLDNDPPQEANSESYMCRDFGQFFFLQFQQLLNGSPEV